MRDKYPRCTTIVSYSDPSVGHTGALYRACNWLWAPTWHRLQPPPTGCGSWDGKKRSSPKDAHDRHANQEVAYAGAVDTNGYFPTHNKRYTQPLTGDERVDMANNRTKRIFDDPVGRKCGAHEQAFLLQTYRRDTGEVMHDLSVPIYVQGRHWGGFRLGYRTE